MQADQRVMHVFLQRHVAHNPRGAEAFGGILGGVVDRLRREHLGDRGERQIGEAVVGECFAMVASPGRLPNGGACDFGLARVDRHRNGKAAGETAHDGQHAGELFFDRHRLGAGPRGFASNVDEVRSLGGHP